MNRVAKTQRATGVVLGARWASSMDTRLSSTSWTCKVPSRAARRRCWTAPIPDPQETSCKFQMTQTAGVYVSRFRFICVTPPMPAGFVAYELIAGTEVTTYDSSVPLPRQGDGHAAGTSVASPRGGEVVFVNGENSCAPPSSGRWLTESARFARWERRRWRRARL